MALDCCSWVPIVLCSVQCSSRSIRLQSVSPRQAVMLVCAALAIMPVCCRSVCVATCSAARTARAAALVRAVSVGGHSLCVRLCACSADAHSISSVVRIDCKMQNCERPQARGVVGVSACMCTKAQMSSSSYSSCASEQIGSGGQEGILTGHHTCSHKCPKQGDFAPLHLDKAREAELIYVSSTSPLKVNMQ